MPSCAPAAPLWWASKSNRIEYQKDAAAAASFFMVLSFLWFSGGNNSSVLPPAGDFPAKESHQSSPGFANPGPQSPWRRWNFGKTASPIPLRARIGLRPAVVRLPPLGISPCKPWELLRLRGICLCRHRCGGPHLDWILAASTLSRGVHPIGGNRSSPLIGRFKGVGCWEGRKSKSPLPNWPLPTFGQTKVGPRRAYLLEKPPVPVQIPVSAGGPVRPGSAAAHWPKPSVSPLSPHQSARK